jgi:hypothetical protein
MIRLWPYLKTEAGELLGGFEAKEDAILGEPIGRTTQNICEK